MNAAIEDGLTCATELPYFEGDFWPNVLEESIKELDQEEEERLKAAEKAAAAQSATEEVNASFKKVDSQLSLVCFTLTFYMERLYQYVCKGCILLFPL